MIRAEKIIKKFDSFTALNNLSCTIPEGTVYGLVGSNGAGKSTFMRLVTGIYRPEAGEITIDGERVYDNPAAKKRIAFVPDELYFLPHANMDRMADLYEANYDTFSRDRMKTSRTPSGSTVKRTSPRFQRA